MINIAIYIINNELRYHCSINYSYIYISVSIAPIKGKMEELLVERKCGSILKFFFHLSPKFSKSEFDNMVYVECFTYTKQ